MTKRMLVIPGLFVPANDTVTLLTYKRLKNLDCEFDVLALKGKEDPGLWQELQNDKDFAKFHIHYLGDYENTISIEHPERLLFSIFNLLRYKRKTVQFAKKQHYDYLYTSSVPGISHLCGLAIKKHFPNIKWFASFSDPIKNSPYKKDPDLQKRSIFYRLAFRVGSWLYMGNRYEEAGIRADTLLFICRQQRDYTLKQHPNPQELLAKSKLLPLTYIEEWQMYRELMTASVAHNTPKKAVHLGRVYGLRKIDNFLSALKNLKEKDPDLGKKIQFHQYSEIQVATVKQIKEYRLEDVFFLHRKVSYRESLRIMKEADILLLFDTIMDGEELQPYLPSKIIEYLLLRKPIFALCQNNAPAWEIMNDYNHPCAYEVEDIEKALLTLLKEKPSVHRSCDEFENKVVSFPL